MSTKNRFTFDSGSLSPRSCFGDTNIKGPRARRVPEPAPRNELLAEKARIERLLSARAASIALLQDTFDSALQQYQHNMQVWHDESRSAEERSAAMAAAEKFRIGKRVQETELADATYEFQKFQRAAEKSIRTLNSGLAEVDAKRAKYEEHFRRVKKLQTPKYREGFNPTTRKIRPPKVNAERRLTGYLGVLEEASFRLGFTVRPDAEIVLRKQLGLDRGR